MTDIDGIGGMVYISYDILERVLTAWNNDADDLPDDPAPDFNRAMQDLAMAVMVDTMRLGERIEEGEDEPPYAAILDQLHRTQKALLKALRERDDLRTQLHTYRTDYDYCRDALERARSERDDLRARLEARPQ